MISKEGLEGGIMCVSVCVCVWVRHGKGLGSLKGESNKRVAQG